MNWNLFWGFYILAFAIAILLVWYFFYYRKSKYKEKCTSKTIGTVIRYSYVQYNGINLPVVKYEVNGITYKVVGPKFKAIITKQSSSPFHKGISEYHTNIDKTSNLPEILKLSIKTNSFVQYQKSPLLELYPVGGSANVYYNPKNPKMAYVERCIQPSKILYILILIVGLILLALGVYIIFGPTIIMK